MADTQEIVLRRCASDKLLWQISQKFSNMSNALDWRSTLSFDGTDTDGYDFVQSRVGPGSSYRDMALATMREWCMVKLVGAKGRELYDVLVTIGMEETADDFRHRLTGGKRYIHVHGVSSTAYGCREVKRRRHTRDRRIEHEWLFN